jgi:hypothetical protein
MPAYNARFARGTRVRVKARPAPDEFAKGWNWHHPLEHGQFAAAGKEFEIQSAVYYHGGDVLYVLSGVAGIWHEACLESE